MLGTVRKMTNINAESIINEEIVVYMSASVKDSSDVIVSKSVKDWTMYKAHIEECDADYAKFEDIVDQIIKGEDENGTADDQS